MNAQYDTSNQRSSEKQEQPTSQNLFARHNDSVLCCSIDNNTRLAVSGGIDDTAFVWDLNTTHVIFECLGHKESVVAAAFSSSSTYVATGDLNGYIQVRNTTTGIKVFDFEIDEINWILWHNSSEFVLLAGTTKGDFWMWNVNDPAAVKTFPAFGSASTAAKLLPDGIRLIVAYQDGSVRMFDLKTRDTIFHYSNPSRAEIISMDLNPNRALLAIGCIDSSIKLITVGNFKEIGTLQCKSPEKLTSTGGEGSTSAKEGEPMDQSGDVDDEDKEYPKVEIDEPIATDEINSIEVIDEYTTTESEPKNKPGDAQGEEKGPNEDEGADFEDESDEDYEDDDKVALESVESVLFSPCGNFLAAASNAGFIRFWDVSTQAARCEKDTGIGITRCAWTREGNYVTGCLDGAIRVYDNNLLNSREIFLHCDQILDVAYRENVLVTASEDKTCRVFKME